MRKHFNSKQSVTVSEAPTLFPPENRPGAKSSLSSVTSSRLLLWDAGAALGIGCRGAHPSLRYMTYGFLILLVFCRKCGLLVLVTRHFLVVHPLLNKIPGPAPAMDASKVKSWWNKVLLSCEGTFKSEPISYRRRVETQSRS